MAAGSVVKRDTECAAVIGNKFNLANVIKKSKADLYYLGIINDRTWGCNGNL